MAGKQEKQKKNCFRCYSVVPRNSLRPDAYFVFSRETIGRRKGCKNIAEDEGRFSKASKKYLFGQGKMFTGKQCNNGKGMKESK